MDRIVTQTRFVKTDLPKPKRVAVYARVSSGKDAMLHSLSAQISYYSQMIKNHSGWEYVGIYADEALTGTKDNRENFQRLLLDCKNNKVDMIITKSISRFARNTLTLLETVRELKSLGIDVYFEEQNIHNQSPDGELMLTILAGYAQEKSLSASENQKWRIRQNFQNGKITNVRRFFGYKIVDGELVVDPITASVVKEIFKRAVDGESFGSIARSLNERGVNGTNGGRWKTGHIADLLGNEKYCGNALLQKNYTVDFLQKKMKKNEGEVPQYYVEHSHPAIISAEEWERVQLEFNRRKDSGRRTICNSPFAGKLICSDCGEIFGSKVWHSNTKY